MELCGLETQTGMGTLGQYLDCPSKFKDIGSQEV